jgi:hypothetical protein
MAEMWRLRQEAVGLLVKDEDGVIPILVQASS